MPSHCSDCSHALASLQMIYGLNKPKYFTQIGPDSPKSKEKTQIPASDV